MKAWERGMAQGSIKFYSSTRGSNPFDPRGSSHQQNPFEGLNPLEEELHRRQRGADVIDITARSSKTEDKN